MDGIQAGEAGERGSHWRLCIDFGTSASKAALADASTQLAGGPRTSPTVFPLRLGSVSGSADAYLAPTAILFGETRVWLGAAALAQAEALDGEREILLSFKTVMGANDLVEVLDMRLPLSLDPHGDLTYGDALIVYIAYLMAAVEAAARLEPSLPPDIAAAERRYSYPMWRPGERTHVVMVTLFDAALRMFDLLGQELLMAEGVERGRLVRALEAGKARPTNARVTTGVFEALAAAECFLAGDTQLPRFSMVFDMGAGTTDICCFERAAGTGSVREIRSLRRTFGLACDQIDDMIVKALCDKAHGEPRPGAQARFWRRMTTRARALKRTLYSKGKIQVSFEKTRIDLKLSELEKSRDYRDYRSALGRAYSDALNALAEQAARAGETRIGVILTGGGANMPLIKDMGRTTRPKNRRIRNVVLSPSTPAWFAQQINDPMLDLLAPQLTVAMGGALANIDVREMATH